MEYDYIIVGAGSAGCVLANQLGEDTSKRILIVEAGPMDHRLLIHIPAGVYSAWHDPTLNWNYTTEPDAQMDDRSIFMPRGKVLGGSSSINSMVYMRGHPLDYDAWAQKPGMAQWAMQNCLPYFIAGENSDRNSPYRGTDGPLGTSQSGLDNPLFDAFVAAGPLAGQGQTDDPNGLRPEGTARLDATRKHGRRCSAAVAHLRPALRRGNVTLLTRAHVEKVNLTKDRATGITFQHKGHQKTAHAGEVILSGGAINSPQLLMLSGIGPSAELQSHGIETLHHLPGVGQKLQDHANVILQFKTPLRLPIHRINNPLQKGIAGLRWIFLRDGLAATNIWEAGGLIKSSDHVDYPNIQYHFGPVAFDYNGNKIDVLQGFAIHVDVLRPRSRGYIRLSSADPIAKPILHFNYYDREDDLTEMVQGIQKTRDLVSQSSFDGLRGAEITPGDHIKTVDDLRAWVRKNSETDFHPCGTCRMGVGPDAVVDPEFKVHGISGLRVVDASVMPKIVSGNLNAPTQMIAARAADFISQKPQRAPLKMPFEY